MSDDNNRAQKTLRKGTFGERWLYSACAASVAESVTFPLDITKTRLQVQGEKRFADGRPHRGLIGTMVGIVKEEGAKGLYSGLAPAVARHVVYTGARFLIYEQLRENVIGRNADGSFPVAKAMLAGSTSGALAQFIASPTDLIKVRMQIEGKRRVQGLPPLYRNSVDCVRLTLKEGGVLGMWRGWLPNCQRAALVNLGELTAYDTAKQTLLAKTALQDNAITHTLSSLCAGLVAATVGTPADVMKSRLMGQPLNPDGSGQLYRGVVDCLVKTVRAEGVPALWKGFIPTWTRMAPWSLTFWLTFEQIRRLMGVSGF